MKETLRTILAEPRSANPPPPSWWDWALAAVLVTASVLGAIFESGIAWRPVAGAVGASFAILLVWRRSHPLLITLVGFGIGGTIATLALVATDGTIVVGAILPIGVVCGYSLGRWASGRETVLGLVAILAAHAITEIPDDTTSALEGVVGSTQWLFPVVLGVAMHYRSSLRDRLLTEARLNERQELARELHDSVAHHVSAIAIQAQAGRALADTRPEAALGILADVEEAASRTLDEMRQMVSALRDPAADAELVPQATLAQIPELASQPGTVPVDVEMTGDLDGLSPSVESSLYRLAQEAITNALRHARHATRVSVRVTGTTDEVRLHVSDDGDLLPQKASPSGFGLVGMAERVAVMGGRFTAHQGDDRGWVVDAALPRTRTST